MDKRKSAFFVGNVGNRQVNKNTYKLFADWLRDPVTKSGVPLKKWKKVSDYMPDDVVKICRSNNCVLGGDVYAWSPKSEAEQEKQHKIEVETFVLGYESLYADALAEFKNKNYKVAAKKYLYMINEYPNNALLRNDLAATYNNLGDYDLAIEQARHVLHIIGDKTQYAAAQYNAGVAYENMGNMQKALANYKLSLANGNKRAKLAIDRVTKLLNKSVDKRTSYNKAIQNVQNRSTSKQAGVYIKHLNSGRV
jgi:tetratricopeptide (TPR) repeat protein